jgi:hypothetical protein
MARVCEKTATLNCSPLVFRLMARPIRVMIGTPFLKNCSNMYETKEIVMFLRITRGRAVCY